MARTVRTIICISALALSAASPVPAGEDEGPTLVERVDRYCIGPDGDHRLTWSLAEEDGFTVLAGPEFQNRQTPGVHRGSIRVFTKGEGVEQVRITTAATFLQSPEQGTTYFRWCWVSANDSLDRTTAALRALLKTPAFRVEKVRIFAWIPRPDGVIEPVRRPAFMREGYTLAREQGLRHVTLKRDGDTVFVGYGSPRDEATYRDFDWAGPEPVAAPE
ncbi:MAG: hypothetical protein EON96_19160 [Caulobacteraceae bacterium]|nr:MAG: hypothetical protein EON96_19160 [Caulobacteraceae bacterium]